MHRTIMVVDVERFGDRRRTNPHQVVLRSGLYEMLQRALAEADIAQGTCRQEDRGDGVLVLAPAEVPKAPFVDSVPHALAEALREHNRCHPVEEQIRLRMALHAGEVQLDGHGVTSTSVNLTFRLLDARPLKIALADSPGVLALIVSGWFFEDVVRHSPTAHPETFRPVRVVEKETSTVAWIALPDHPYPPDPTALTAPPPDPAVGPVPHQLPVAPGSFIGRRDELAALTTALNAATGPGASGTTVVISAIGGAGGIGKTALALHWAHANLDRFPDGQLYVNLRGFDPSGRPTPVGEAVRGFLDALGVDVATLPVELDAQAARYRSLVAGKRMLIVLDNAADADHVVPLLPGSPTCMVLVTSRHHLAGIAAALGARLLDLDVLPESDARELLARRLGDERLATEPLAVAELLAVCAGLPLAVAIVAARAAHHPTFPLTVLAEELHDVSARLDGLDAGDLHANLRAVLSWSIRTLSARAAGLFGLLAIAPGPDVSLPAVASLTDRPAGQVRAVLRDLEHACMVQQHVPGRYRMHDLIRLYAADTAHHDVTEDGRNAALRRVLDFYTHTAYAAARLLDPHAQPIRLTPPVSGVHPQVLPDVAAAWAWLDTEHSVLLAAQHAAAGHCWHPTVWQLAWALDTFHIWRGHLCDRLAVWQAALDATTHLPEPTPGMQAHRALGRAYADLGRYEEGMGHLHQALALAEDHHDPDQQAHTHRALARAWEQRGDDRQALQHATRTLDLYRVLDQPIGEAKALNAVGWFAARLGEYATARTHCQAALTLLRDHNNREGEALALDSLGYIAHHTGHHQRAIGYYGQALTLLRDLGNASETVDTLDNLGHPHAALGEHEQARTVWQEALQLYQKQGRTTDADRVQRQLDNLAPRDRAARRSE